MDRQMMTLIAAAGESADPALFGRLAPRHYAVPSGYLSPRVVGGVFTATVAVGGRKQAPYGDVVAQTGYAVATKLAQYAVPTYFVGRELLPAIVATDPPALPPAELRWPFPAILFVLPEDAWSSPADGGCPFLAVARFEAGEVTQLPGYDPVLHTKTRIACYASSEKGPGFGIYEDLEGDSLAAIIKSDDPYLFWRIEDLVSGATRPEPLSQEDCSFVDRLLGLGLRLLLTMTARPDLVERGHLERPATAKKGKERAALWSPNFLGRHYRVRREAGPPGGGSRPSPRMHWRMGHWRHQAVGPREAHEHKLLWIEPVLVAGAGESR